MAGRIMVIGCGGLGCAAVPILAAAGIGRLTLVDDDRIDLSNLQRQTYFTQDDIGEFKVETLACFLKRQNPEVTLDLHSRRLSFPELRDQIGQHDLVLDCSDNLKTRQQVNHAAFMEKVPLVFASATRFEGQLSIFDSNREDSPCYACLFGGKDSGQDSCSFTGVFSPLVSIMGSMQASEALKMIAGIGQPMIGRLLHYNAMNASFHSMQCDRNPACELCGQSDRMA